MKRNLEFGIYRAYPEQFMELGEIHIFRELDIRQKRERYGDYEAFVSKITRIYESGGILPPLILIQEVNGKKNVLVDGFTRIEAFEKLQVKHPVRIVIIPIVTTLELAVNLATLINDQHGKPLDSVDKERVYAFLADRGWSPEYLSKLYNVPRIIPGSAEVNMVEVKDKDVLSGKTVVRKKGFARGFKERLKTGIKPRLVLADLDENEKRRLTEINKASTIVSLCTNLHGYLRFAKEKFELTESETKALRTIYNDIMDLNLVEKVVA